MGREMPMQRCTGVRYGNASLAPFPLQWRPLRRRRAIPRIFTDIEFDHEINTTGRALEFHRRCRNTPAHPATYWRAEGLNSCMKAKSLFPIIPALMISVAMATTSIAAEKVKPEAVSKGMLTALNNQVGLSADQQNKAKPIIDKHVADLEAVKNDATSDKAAKKAKVVQLRQQYVTDINGILTPDQQKKWAAARETNKAKVKAGVKQRAAEKA